MTDATAITSVTQLLRDWRAGDQTALDLLLPLVQTELHNLARRMISRENPGHTWQTTDLLHETYLRLAGQSQADWQDRAHFYAIAAQTMRHLLVDHARARQMQKRGGDAQRVDLEETSVATPERSTELLALHEALTRLAVFDRQKSRIVELRYFGGLTVEEVAEVLGIAAVTVKREWARAKLWLHKEMQPHIV